MSAIDSAGLATPLFSHDDAVWDVKVVKMLLSKYGDGVIFIGNVVAVRTWVRLNLVGKTAWPRLSREVLCASSFLPLPLLFLQVGGVGCTLLSVVGQPVLVLSRPCCSY